MLEVHSSSFADGQEIPQRHGKGGGNVSPDLWWEDGPSGTRSYAIAMVDRDPVAKNYVHWLVVDIDPQTNELPEGAAAAMPTGASEASPYTGPFPPSGTHDYEITLYALDTPRLDLPSEPSLDLFLEAVQPATLGSASLVGTFTRS
jgi:Raf kinase inhibitor-like YbhB/YbcL family protein